ncbi:hypothetical protein NE237_020736 [Protea cynaroides]|uniref:Non-specific serine/threonine protein kinase n=1 Tax=Protea cynaroides TaxID=273540 RepID=A0A9Q0K2L1_9MAGN|nr:hypothetical protein NE237_020736 [Protea cynaroides]
MNIFYQLQSLPSTITLCGRIPLSLSKLSMLEQISVSNNQVNGTIPSEIGSFSRLQTLICPTMSFMEALASLCNLSSLVQLSFEGNNLLSLLTGLLMVKSQLQCSPFSLYFV